MEKRKGLLSKIFSNTRKPQGFFGRLMLAGMNGGSHAAMATWGLEIIDIPQTGEILDIGCGGGANIARLLARSKASKVTGVDYSPVSVAKTSKVNADAIAKGRCEVLEADVAALACFFFFNLPTIVFLCLELQLLEKSPLLCLVHCYVIRT